MIILPSTWFLHQFLIFTNNGNNEVLKLQHDYTLAKTSLGNKVN